MKMPSQDVRAYIYRVLLAAGAVATFYGLMTAEELAVWGGLAVTVLMVLPTANTPTTRGKHAADE